MNDPNGDQLILSAKRERLLFYLIILVACVAALVAIADAWSRLSQRFDYEHAWISAHFATSARAFASEGVLPLHGVPIVNNPPFERPPLAYLHWPPLYSMMLAWVFEGFGGSETAGHALMLLFLCINTVLIGWLAHAL